MSLIKYLLTILIILSTLCGLLIVSGQRPLINITTNTITLNPNLNPNLNTNTNNNNVINYINEKLPIQPKSTWRNGQVITATTTQPPPYSTETRNRDLERATRIPPFRPGRKPQSNSKTAFASLRELARLNNLNNNNANNTGSKLVNIHNPTNDNDGVIIHGGVSLLNNLQRLPNNQYSHQQGQKFDKPIGNYLDPNFTPSGSIQQFNNHNNDVYNINTMNNISSSHLSNYNNNHGSSSSGILNTHTPQRQQYAMRQPNFDPMKKGMNALKIMLAEQPVPYQEDFHFNESDNNSTSLNAFLTIRDRVSKNYGNRPRSDINQSSEIEDILGVKCTFETECAWKWNESMPDGFHVMNGANLTEFNISGLFPGPKADSFNNAYGNFLYVRLTNATPITLTSPLFTNTLDTCKLALQMHQSFMSSGHISVVIDPLHPQENPWVPSETLGDNYNSWEFKQFEIGRISRDFRVVLEIDPRIMDHYHRAHVAIDNLRMVGCFKESAKNRNCSTTQIKCQTNKVPVCIDLESICDIDQDCDENEDELLSCDKIPYGGRCDFENDWCGWQNGGKTMLLWSRHTGPSPTDKTGPDHDHTFQHLSNSSGFYMLVNMNQHAQDDVSKKSVGFASNAIMNSKIFNPPPLVHGDTGSPYRNSCMARFNVNQNGMNPGSINFSVVELREKENVTTTLWWSMKNRGEFWHRETLVLPNITTRYFLQFEARMGMRIYSDVAVDDISLSPECFGINIPDDQLDGYDYWNPRLSVKKDPHKDFASRTFLELSTCGARGIQGPTPKLCETAYSADNNLHVLNNIKVIEKDNYKGMQKWKVPNEGYYTVISKGAGGGLGSNGVGSSRGATAISVFELHKNEELFILVGQKGENACIKSFNQKEEGCQSNESEKVPEYVGYTSKTHMVKNFVIDSAAGGGGGGTFVFLINSANRDAIPLMVAGGGGGLGIGRYLDEDFQHGQKYDPDRLNITGLAHGDGNRTAGPGGGWRARDDAALGPTFGASLLEGGRGGLACYSTAASKGLHGQGGFGGGGGGCNTGGGGGGFSGGDTFMDATNGEGGTSFINVRRTLKDFNKILQAENTGHGSLIIIPAIEGCGCDYRCLALDEYRSETKCICPDKWRLKRDNSTQCEIIDDGEHDIGWLVIFLCIISVLLVAALSILIFMLYNRYLRRKAAAQRHKMLQDQDLQLSRLRHNTDDSALTNFNPNYGCDGIINGNVDVKSLPQVARESLRLVKALGQGAFGEVYQGLYRHRDGDAVEMPVAVKTLPDMSTVQAEADFLMEAAIMAKFNHPNIVHLIGVCFDLHPRFIVLELLAGGDLKNFLREGRSKPERPSTLTMKDLVFCALDVAKGCRYMESRRFIHRDIAARNCLLSSKGPGRVVKIADFGMARDIYRSDYYRKGGKAMLPIKWMPPEAFLDGIFTSKTDVWSFGVLLWEVFSLGLMPYTGLPNREVMQQVTTGGRLEAPPSCPAAIYTIMAECWNPTPEERPPFSNLLERLNTCTQDPEVMNSPLPTVFFRTQSERDQTVMRPPGGNDEFCIQLLNSSDYLIPLPGPRAGTERLLRDGNEVVTQTETTPTTTCSAPIVTSPSTPNQHLQQIPISDENDVDGDGDGEIGNGGCWETSFIMPTTNSNENLLQNDCNNKPMNGIDGIIMNHNNHHNDHHHHHHHHHHHPAQYSPPSRLTSNTGTEIMNGGGNNGISVLQNGGSAISKNIPLSHGCPQTPDNDENIDIMNAVIAAAINQDDDDTRLISLDTPQPTPTTIKPPMSFAQLDGITLDPAALNKGQSPGSLRNNKPQAYANIQMAAGNNLIEHHNGTGGGVNNGGVDKLMNGNLSSGTLNGSSSTISANSAPFTIQGFNDRYINKDNHSEISC